MLKLIIRMPENSDPYRLMISAVALAQYKIKRPYGFDSYGLRDMNPSGYYGDYTDYSDIDLQGFEPIRIWERVNRLEDYQNNVAEYEVDGYMLDPFLMEQLVELQKVIPFEMYFEQRGLYNPRDQEDYIGDIDDLAIADLSRAVKTA